MNLIDALAGRVGERTAGSSGASVAADVVAGALSDLGLAPRFQEFPLLGYEAGEPELEIDGERWAAGPCVYAHPTPPEGVAGRVRWIGDQPHGLVGESRAPVFVIEEPDGTEIARLCVNPVTSAAIPFLSLQHVSVTIGPTVYISVEDGQRLARRAGARARLVTRGRFVPGQRERNVIADLPGRSDEAVVVSAHFDSVWRGPGAIDNASGVEGVRRVAERLAGRSLARTVTFVAFAAEEPGCVGSHYFVQEARLRGDLRRIVGVVNLDCIARGDSLVLMVGPEELRARALDSAHALGLDRRHEIVVEERDRGSDHYWFGTEGVPAVSILQFPYPEYHLPADRPELVDDATLSDCVELAVALVESQVDRPVARG